MAPSEPPSEPLESESVDVDSVVTEGIAIPDASEAIESRCIDATNDPEGDLAARSSSEARLDEEQNSNRTSEAPNVNMKERLGNGSGFPVNADAQNDYLGKSFQMCR